MLNNGAKPCDMKTSSVFARIKFLWTQIHALFFFGFEAEELKEPSWLPALLAFESKDIAILWLESDTKTQGGVWGNLL